MEIKEYLEKKKSLQKLLIEFIDHGKTIIIDDELKKLLDDPKVKEDKYNLKSIFNLTLAIANNHHRYSDFYPKIEQILLLFKENIIQHFSNAEIFNIFNSNKRILLFLVKEKLLNLDQSIVELLQREEFLMAKYQFYLFPEIKALVNSQLKNDIQKEVRDLSSKNFGIFEQKRNLGENDEKICELIRKDSVEEFVSYLKKENISLTSKIPPSIFETNSFLFDNEPTLIEYAAFFGSIKVFQYLQSNGAELIPSLWLYSIHGNKPELLDILKENQINPKDQTYKECLNESIKCHHDEIMKYIQTNFLQNQNLDEYVLQSSAKYHNYALLPNDVNNVYFFYSLCQNGNVQLVEALLKCANVKNNINTIIVLKLIEFLNKVPMLIIVNMISNLIVFLIKFQIIVF